MLLHITHETRYDYDPAVGVAHHLAHLKPLQRPGQRLLEHRLHISPMPAQCTEDLDLYGNTRTFFTLQSAHEQLLVRAESRVQTAPLPQATKASANQPWEAVREGFRYRKGLRDDTASEFLFASPYVPTHADFADYAQPSFPAGRPLLEAATDLMLRMHRDLRYVSGSTEISTPARVALAQRQGVCQDFAHILLACCRSLGLPARYVSGYLLTQPPPGTARLIGADASHAWGEIYLPGPPSEPGGTPTPGHWFGLDPTNGRPSGEDYVALALGRDYADVPPLRGVLLGGARHVLHVGVTVRPDHENAPPAASL